MAVANIEDGYMGISNLVRRLIVGAALVVAPAASFAGVFVSVTIAPPVLPVYTQPLCPGDGYLWNPGYWAYGDAGYYWVPGVWVRPPQVGLLWTPGYWGWGGGVYLFHAGYWGPHVGFYGGVNYGFGYGGSGFYGGRWDGGHFAYNTAVVNVNRTVIHNTYVDRTYVNNTYVNHSRTSFNGGAGGIEARPSAQEAAFARENHVAPTAEQQSHVQMARADRGNFASVNGGRPQMAAARTPSEYHAAVQQRVSAPAQNARPAVQQDYRGGAQPQQHAQAQPQQFHEQAQPQQHVQSQQFHEQTQPQHTQSQQPHQQAQPHAQQSHEQQPHEEGGHEHH
jgi:WXXGXW repeat (2 copies)